MYQQLTFVGTNIGCHMSHATDSHKTYTLETLQCSEHGSMLTQE
jgi:hypothetical protein